MTYQVISKPSATNRSPFDIVKVQSSSNASHASNFTEKNTNWLNYNSSNQEIESVDSGNLYFNMSVSFHGGSTGYGLYGYEAKQSSDPKQRAYVTPVGFTGYGAGHYFKGPDNSYGFDSSFKKVNTYNVSFNYYLETNRSKTIVNRLE